MDLRQRKLFTVREFTLKETRLNVKIKNLISSYEVEIPFEEINFDKMIRQKKTDILIVVIAVFLSLMFLIFLVDMFSGNSDLKQDVLFGYLFFTALSWLIAYLNSKSQVIFPTFNNGYIEIFDGRPTKEISDNFIKDLKVKSNNYLKNKYSVIDKNLPVESQLANLIWLKEKEILKSEEFEILKNKLLGREGESQQIGFN